MPSGSHGNRLNPLKAWPGMRPPSSLAAPALHTVDSSSEEYMALSAAASAHTPAIEYSDEGCGNAAAVAEVTDNEDAVAGCENAGGSR